MSKLNIDQKTIFELFSDKKADFLIPDYQRPYAWDYSECQTLWEDIFNFAFPDNDYSKFDSDSDEYFLGPIVTFVNDYKKMEVIDGQQRLTTLFIIISFMQRNFVDKVITREADILRYSIRDTTDQFLRNKIQTGILWNSEIDPSQAASKDQYYIMVVAKAVKEWFDNDDNHLSPETLLHDLKLIVNEVDNGDEENVFASLNGGKVDLDGADLMRAILITRAAKQKYSDIHLHDEISHIAGESISLNIRVNV